MGGRTALRAAMVSILLWTGCATVKPAEREMLADPAMTYGSDGPSGSHEAHVLNNREGSFGAGEATGGGCGCN